MSTYKLGFLLFLSLALLNGIIAQERLSESEWVEKKLNQMTLEDKVAQLFVIRSKSDQNEADIQATKTLLAKLNSPMHFKKSREYL